MSQANLGQAVVRFFLSPPLPLSGQAQSGGPCRTAFHGRAAPPAEQVG